jgi:hypothetical protein
MNAQPSLLPSLPKGEREAIASLLLVGEGSGMRDHTPINLYKEQTSDL